MDLINIKEAQCRNISNYLINCGKLDLIDLLAKAERHEIHTIKIKRKLVESTPYHNAIISFLKRYGVEIIYPYEEKEVKC
jgi:hypothetical protein